MWGIIPVYSWYIPVLYHVYIWHAKLMALLHRPSTTYGQWMNSLQQSSDILVLLLSYPYIIIVICLYYNSYMVVIFLIYFCHINIVSLSYIIAIPVTDLSYFFQMFVICLSYACHMLVIFFQYTDVLTAKALHHAGAAMYMRSTTGCGTLAGPSLESEDFQ